MQNVYQSPRAAGLQAASTPAAPDEGCWHLGADTAHSLVAAPRERRLHVDHGCLWVTFTRTAALCHTTDATDTTDATALTAGPCPDLPPADTDRWLTTGQVLCMPAGCAAVLEAWPQAAFRLLEAPPAALRSRATTAATPSAAAAQPVVAQPVVAFFLAGALRAAAFFGAGARARSAASMAS